MVVRCFWLGVTLCVAAFVSGASTLPANSYPACQSLTPDGLHYLVLGDGVCNAIYNIEECGYDGGDCCPCTCTSQPRGEDGFGSECGSAGYNCMDPTASCFEEPAVALRHLQSSDAYGDTFAPTSSPTASPTSPTPLDELEEESSSGSSGLTGAAIGAIVAVCIVAAVIAIIYFLYKKSRRQDDGPEYAAAGSTNLA